MIKHAENTWNRRNISIVKHAKNRWNRRNIVKHAKNTWNRRNISIVKHSKNTWNRRNISIIYVYCVGTTVYIMSSQMYKHYRVYN